MSPYSITRTVSVAFREWMRQRGGMTGTGCCRLLTLGKGLRQPIGDGEARSATTGDNEIILGSKLRHLAPNCRVRRSTRKPNNRHNDGKRQQHDGLSPLWQMSERLQWLGLGANKGEISWPEPTLYQSFPYEGGGSPVSESGVPNPTTGTLGGAWSMQRPLQRFCRSSCCYPR